MNICGKELTGERKLDRKFRFLDNRNECCKSEANDSQLDCDSAAWPKGIFFPSTLRFAGNEELWIKNYLKAWKMATENGHLTLSSLDKDT